jgi:HSP20 family protein
MTNITVLPERTSVSSLLPSKWNWDEFFSFPWIESVSKTRLPEVFRAAMPPPINISETDKAVQVTVDLPGLEEKDIDVKIMGNQLTIAAERRWEEEKKGREFHRVESQYGRFDRSVTLPENLRTGACDAVYRKGVLTLTFPKVEPTPATRVNVKAG